jgi:hypothetical protein
VFFCGVTPCVRAGCYPDFGGTFCLNDSFRGVERPGPEFDNSSPFSDAMKNDIPIPLHLPFAFVPYTGTNVPTPFHYHYYYHHHHHP